MDKYSLHNLIGFLGAEEDTLNVAKIILKDSDDCINFYNNFLGRGEDISDDVFNFRKFKIEDNFLNISNFLKHYAENDYTINNKFLENVFLQSVSDSDVLLVNEIADKDIIKLYNVYKLFYDNPCNNVLKYMI